MCQALCWLLQCRNQWWFHWMHQCFVYILCLQYILYKSLLPYRTKMWLVGRLVTWQFLNKGSFPPLVLLLWNSFTAETEWATEYKEKGTITAHLNRPTRCHQVVCSHCRVKAIQCWKGNDCSAPKPNSESMGMLLSMQPDCGWTVNGDRLLHWDHYNHPERRKWGCCYLVSQHTFLLKTFQAWLHYLSSFKAHFCKKKKPKRIEKEGK